MHDNRNGAQPKGGGGRTCWKYCEPSLQRGATSTAQQRPGDIGSSGLSGFLTTVTLIVTLNLDTRLST